MDEAGDLDGNPPANPSAVLVRLSVVDRIAADRTNRIVELEHEEKAKC